MLDSGAQSVAELTENRYWGFIKPYENRDELIREICLRLMQGEPLAAMCREEGMPSARVVANWADGEPAISAAIAQARALGEEAIALEAQEIIDGLRPVPGVPPDAARDKARADVRLKLLAKFNPKRWGDSTQLRHADADGEKINNSGLVSELLNLMGANTQAPIEGKAKLKNVTPEPAKSVYRPRIARPVDDVDDLV